LDFSGVVKILKHAPSFGGEAKYVSHVHSFAGM
jgi:hypothetical protein